MTGTRSALLGLLLLCVILPVVLLVFRDHVASKKWDIGVWVAGATGAGNDGPRSGPDPDP